MPIDRGLIDAQLREIGEGERWWEQREFRELPYILNADETLRGIAEGALLGSRRPRLRSLSGWLLVATSQRLLCLRHERFARKQVDVPWAEVVRVQQRTGMRGYQLILETRERRYRVRVPKGEALRFTRAVGPLLPGSVVRHPGPEIDSLKWIPGIQTVATLPGLGGIVSKVALLSPPDYASREQVERLEATVERLHDEVERLQQQVAFLESLLQERTGTPALPRSGPGS